MKKNPMTKKEFLRGIIAAVVSLALLLVLQAVEKADLFKPTASSAPSASVEGAEGAYTPGTYTASEYGFGGDVVVTLTVGENGGIESAQVVGDSETPEVGGAALDTLAQQILDAQSAEIDGVSGASLTSGACKAAAAAALAEASGEAVEKGPTPEGDNLFVPGTYEGASTGFGGEITATVTVDENAITDIQIVGDHETENIGSFAVELLGESIMNAQSPKVDTLTGATVSSNGILKAVNLALTAAGADLSRFEDATTVIDPNAAKSEETLDCDIVIIGAGGAGMTAAINATQQGKNVILLEKMPYVGGNTTKATGGMNAAETRYQKACYEEAIANKDEKAEDYNDSVEQFVADTMEGGHQLNNIELVTKMAQESSSAIDWLESIGAPLPKLSFSGGASKSRIHSPEDGSGVGAYLVTRFLNKMNELNINVMYNTTATELIKDGDKIVGVKAESTDTAYTINASAVILTSGGFGSNEEMLVGYRPDLKGTVSTNAPGVTGDGIVMAQAVGADLVDIEQIQLHPTVEQATSMLITEGVRGDGAILVNQSGKRFTNELLTRDAVSAAELEQEGAYAYVIFDQNLRDNLAAIEKYVAIGIVSEGATIEELAEKINIDPATLAETLDTWNKAVAAQKDEEFGRETGMDEDLSVAPYYAIKIAPGIHHTMGGVKINTNGEVINTEGKVIPGLFAAGEVTGGVHGGNRLGGNAVADIVVFGKVSSQSAVDYISK